MIYFFKHLKFPSTFRYKFLCERKVNVWLPHKKYSAGDTRDTLGQKCCLQLLLQVAEWGQSFPRRIANPFSYIAEMQLDLGQQKA